VNKYYVLYHERDQSFHRPGTQTLQTSGRKVAVKTLAHARPQPADPREQAAEYQQRAPANGDGQGHEEVAADAVGQQRQRGQHRDLPDWRAAEAVHEAHDVDLVPLRRQHLGDVDVVEDLGVYAGVFERKYGREGGNDGLGGESKGAD
jgi:hypothetical protein